MHKLNISILVVFFCNTLSLHAQQIISEKQTPNSFSIRSATIYVDVTDFTVVQKAAALLQQDMQMITGVQPLLQHDIKAPTKNIILIGSIEKSVLIQQLVRQKKINIDSLKSKWEGYQLQTIAHPFKDVDNALVIIGSDRRGTAFGVFELSKQIGVSPWYWWADVPVKKKTTLYVAKNSFVNDAPKVKYRGIFINDEAPALSGWSKEKFGGFNHLFYTKVFELLLRLKSNYIWPAMWGNAFYDDDSLNIQMADEYGIVIGTSHHEPLMKAHDEWKRYGKGKWNFDSNEVRLKAFWKEGMLRATNEKIVTVGMRGDGDEPMTEGTATSLLERIVKEQRKIIETITGKPAAETPQLWALYKEVQDYYDHGMRVPDDVTLLLCDDNWGNIRKLPKLNEPARKGGYGIYYHFDYVGDPRNYKWLNTNQVARVWEQMHLAWEYNARQIWIVNVGDIKPMEFPISFFLDYAWNPEKIGAGDLQKYTEQWSAAQFGNSYAKEIADIISTYTKYNDRKKPELLNENTYSIDHYEEAQKVTDSYYDLLKRAEKINAQLAPEYRAAYFQLVLHPVKACANLQALYTTVAINQRQAAEGNTHANKLAEKAKQLYQNDSLITLQYHAIANGKWNHMMDQTHIGYTYWQQPLQQKMPEVKYVAADSAIEDNAIIMGKAKTAQLLIPANKKGAVFFENNGYVSIEADNFTKAINSNAITWTILPDHGRTGNAITTFPVTSAAQKITANPPHLQYEIYLYDSGKVEMQTYFSPTLNFHNDAGLQFAISIDEEQPQVITLNKESNDVKIWSGWVANNIIIKSTTHFIKNPGRHIVKYWMVSPCVVLQKLVVNFGGVQQSYLGPPETKFNN